MATLASIENSTWGMSIIGYGVIAEGIAVIRQRLDLVIRTTKGSDPMRPAFGSNIHKYVDAPLNVAIPNIKAEIVFALDMWMPEIKVISIEHTMKTAYNPVFAITYRVLDDTIIDQLLFDIRQGTTTSAVASDILLQAFFPPNPLSYRYQIKLVRNSVEVGPTPNPAGYTTISQMFDWILANWFFWGRWFLLTDRIVCYMKSEGVTNASLSISLLQIVQISALFPPMEPGLFFSVSLTVNGSPAVPEMPETFNNAGEVLFWAQENWGNYGDWTLEGVLSADNSVFSDEFSFEFDSPTPDTFKLVLTTNVPGFTGELQIITV